MSCCIFCKRDSSTSRSREHIIPESLGNSQAVLSPGVVCDKCNNYFAREVEAPFLCSPLFRNLRFRQVLTNKRGRVPFEEGVLDETHPVTLIRHAKGPLVGEMRLDPVAFEHVMNQPECHVIFPIGGAPPSDAVVSRFLAKAGLEALTQRFMEAPGAQDYVVGESQFDPIRRHAREGHPKQWPYHMRRIYEENHKVLDVSGQQAQMVYEYDFLETPMHEIYYVLALFGVEYAINIGGPDIEGYEAWLNVHSGQSPLYFRQE